MDIYPTKKDQDGNPLISECQKYGFWDFYNTAEVKTLFRSIYYNE